MTVLLREQHSYPCAAIVAYFKTGLVNEVDSKVSKALQKAIIGGNLQSAPFKDARTIRALGGKLTVGADLGYADYCIVLPSKNVNDLLAAQADMLLHPSLTPDSARRAAMAIEAEEARRCEDPSDYSNGQVKAMAASNTEDAASTNYTIAGASGDRLSEFYKNRYRPENLILSVVGDVPTFDTLVQIERLYADFGAAGDNGGTGDKSDAAAPGTPKADLTAGSGAASGQNRSAPAVLPDSRNETRKLLYLGSRGAISQSVVTVGYRAAGLSSDDWPALDVLAALLGQGRGSALATTLLLSQGVVNRVASDYTAGPDAGLFCVQLWLSPAAIDKAEASLFKEVDRLIKAPPDPVELTRAKAIAEIRLDERVEDFMGTALVMAEQGAARDGIMSPAILVSRIRSVRGEDVQYAAARYLALSNVSVHEYEPLTAPARSFDSASFARTVVSWAPGLAQSAGATPIPKPPASPAPRISDKERAAQNQSEAEAENVQPLPVRDFSTLNGPKVFVREDHTRPEVSIAILFLGGRVSETETNAGISNLMLRVLLYGTPRIPREQAATALDRLGTDLRLVNEPDYFGLVLTCLSSKAGEALRLLRDLVEVPAFRDADVERAKQEQIGLIRAARDSEAERAYRLMLEGVFSGHSYGMGEYGLETVVEKLKGDDLRDWYAKTIKGQFPLAVIVGDTDGSALVSEGIAGEFKRRDLAETLKVKVPGRPTNAEKTEQASCPATIQFLGFPGPKSESNDVTALDLIQEYLNGPAGSLEEDITSRQAVGWGISMGFRALTAGGVVYAGIESAPDDQQRARAAAISKFQQLAAGALAQDELETARGLAMTSAFQSLANQQVRALAYAAALCSKRELSYVDGFINTLDKVSAADVKRVASTYLKPGAFSAGMLQGPGAKQAAPATR
jgi:zinc protease